MRRLILRPPIPLSRDGEMSEGPAMPCAVEEGFVGGGERLLGCRSNEAF